MHQFVSLRRLFLPILSGVLASVFISGCAMAPAPVSGWAYTNVRGPIAATSKEDWSDKKVGSATAKSILGLIATGDASIQAAAKNGGITKIHHVDHETRSVLGVIAEFTTIVYGE